MITNFDCLQLAFFRAKLAPPSRFCLCVCLNTALELVDLFPPMIELFLHVRQLVSESRFCLFTPLVEVELDLTQGF